MNGAYEVAGETVTMPVEVRDASSWFASFVVEARAAQDLIEYSGLRVRQPFPGRALCNVAAVRYVDSDLGPYHEVGVAVLVRPPKGLGRVGAFIHQLPVNQSFTCEAGRSIWGFPKFIADIDLVEQGRGGLACTVEEDGEHVLTLTMRPGLPMPSRGTAVDAYSWCNGVLRRTAWTMKVGGTRARFGGVSLILGDHPIGKELRSLGLPKRALMSGFVRRMRMSFDAPEVV